MKPDSREIAIEMTFENIKELLQEYKDEPNVLEFLEKLKNEVQKELRGEK